MTFDGRRLKILLNVQICLAHYLEQSLEGPYQTVLEAVLCVLYDVVLDETNI